MGKQNFKTVIINTLGNSSKKELSTSTLAPTFEKNVKDVAIIGADEYRLVCQLKKAQIFAISMRNLELQAENEAKPEINPKTIVPEKYHDTLNIFSKKDLDTLPFHQKYDYMIILEDKQKYNHAFLYKMSLQKLDTIKRYLNPHLAKGFIQANLASYLSSVFFVKKPSREIQFYVEYQRLNTITKKDQYLIPLIKKTLAQLKDAKYFTKIYI